MIGGELAFADAQGPLDERPCLPRPLATLLEEPEVAENLGDLDGVRSVHRFADREAPLVEGDRRVEVFVFAVIVLALENGEVVDGTAGLSVDGAMDRLV